MSMLGTLAKRAEEEIRRIPAGLIDENPDNFYGLRELEDLADSIAANGLEQNLVVTPTDTGRYRLITGGRRYAANRLNQTRHPEAYMTELPCLVRADEGTEREMLRLIATNQYRELTEWERLQQVKRAGEAVKALKKRGVTSVGGVSLAGAPRDVIAALTGMSAGTVAKYTAIGNRLSEDLTEHLREGLMPMTVAYEASRLDKEEQKELAQTFGAGESELKAIGKKDVEKIRAAHDEKTTESAADGTAERCRKAAEEKTMPDSPAEWRTGDPEESCRAVLLIEYVYDGEVLYDYVLAEWIANWGWTAGWDGGYCLNLYGGSIRAWYAVPECPQAILEEEP